MLIVSGGREVFIVHVGEEEKLVRSIGFVSNWSGVERSGMCHRGRSPRSFLHIFTTGLAALFLVMLLF
jgi:hypothetical protein